MEVAMMDSKIDDSASHISLVRVSQEDSTGHLSAVAMMLLEYRLLVDLTVIETLL
jgi:hypothetical protein